MNTLTLSTGTRMTAGNYYRALEPGLAQARPETRQMPTWLPAPTAIRVAPRRLQPAGSTRKVRYSHRREWCREFQFQRVALLFLACAAAIGIVYGFSHLIDLVQHWAVFNAGVGRLIQ